MRTPIPTFPRRVEGAAPSPISGDDLGRSRLASSLVPRQLNFALALALYVYNPAQAKRLLAEAGFPHGFDAGDVTPIPPFTWMGESVMNYPGAAGIRARVRVMEPALHAMGPQVAEAASASTPLIYFPTPYEDTSLKE
jgi:ABC-type transport system substrate-binding protein